MKKYLFFWILLLVSTIVLGQTVVPSGYGIVYVKKGASGNGSSWANALGELAPALRAAYTNKSIRSIWVTEGLYKPLYDHQLNQTSTPRNRTFVMINNVRVFGGFKGHELTVSKREGEVSKTILSGDINGNDTKMTAGSTGIITNLTLRTDNVYHVVVGAGMSSLTVLDGFTITGGHADKVGSSKYSVNGYEIDHHWGGGVYLDKSEMRISNCLITQNYASQSGGAINIEGSKSVANFANLVVYDNFTEDNGTGIAVINSSELKLTNCVLAHNYSSSTSSSEGFGLLLRDNAKAIIYNSIIWGNTRNVTSATQPAISHPNRATVNNTILSPNTGFAFGSSGNLSQDPLFVNPSVGNYSLKANSPAIDKGNNRYFSRAAFGYKDLANKNRFDSNEIDIGAYEYQKDIPAPKGLPLQIYAGNKTLSSLSVDGAAVKWYSAASGGSPLSSSTAMADGQTYYASQTVGGVESVSRLAVSVKRIADDTQDFNEGMQASALVATPATGFKARWFRDAAGNTPLQPNEVLTAGKYYVETYNEPKPTQLWISDQHIWDINVGDDGNILALRGRLESEPRYCKITKVNPDTKNGLDLYNFDAVLSHKEYISYVASDKQGNVYGFNSFTDNRSEGYKVYKWYKTSGMILPFCSTGQDPNGFVKDNYLYIGSYNKKLLEDGSTSYIFQVVNLEDGSEEKFEYEDLLKPGGNGWFTSLLVDKDGDIYTTQFSYVRLIDSRSGLIRTLSEKFSYGYAPLKIKMDQLGEIYISNIREEGSSYSTINKMDSFGNMVPLIRGMYTDIGGDFTIGANGEFFVTGGINPNLHLKKIDKPLVSNRVAVDVQLPDPSLPVVLVSYTVTAEGNHAKLQWQTASEQDNQGFVIYRSGNDGNFVKIGEVPVSGNLQSTTYHFTDRQPLNGTNYYKLVQLDKDGKTTNLGERRLNLSVPAPDIQLYPNPTQNKVTVAYPPEKYTAIILVDVNGKTIKKLSINKASSSTVFDVADLPAGIYMFHLTGNAAPAPIKMIKQ